MSVASILLIVSFILALLAAVNVPSRISLFAAAFAFFILYLLLGTDVLHH